MTGSLGYLPGWTGMGEDLPAGVAKEWAAWCQSPEYVMGAKPDARSRFAAFDRPVLFYSFTDDDYAPRPAVEALVSALSGAEITHRRLRPVDVGDQPIGHFGFFRKQFAESLWPEALAFIDDLLSDGHGYRDLATRPWCHFTEADVMADLSHGRA
jgi:predicted alpha/beta hydrolase